MKKSQVLSYLCALHDRLEAASDEISDVLLNLNELYKIVEKSEPFVLKKGGKRGGIQKKT